MSEAWIPVFFAAVIVFGVVGGSAVKAIVRELLPLLRTMVEDGRAPKTDMARLAGVLESIEQRLDRVEIAQRELKDEGDFVQKLLSERTPTGPPVNPARHVADGPASGPEPSDQDRLSRPADPPGAPAP